MAKVTSDPGGSRRERQRRELLTDIGEATRAIVVDEGVAAVTMAAVAERVGVTAPALYRYVDGRTGLLELACVRIAGQLVQHLTSTRANLGDDPLDQVLGMFRELRRWALAHRAEFAMLFAHPATAYERASARPDQEPTRTGTSGTSTSGPGTPGPGTLGTSTSGTWTRNTGAQSSADLALTAVFELEWVLEEALVRLWNERPFPVPAEADVPEDLRASVQTFVDRVFERVNAAGLQVSDAPIAAAAVLIGFWVRVYGMISMEVFGHLSYAVTDGGPLFEFVLDEFARMVRGDASTDPGT